MMPSWPAETNPTQTIACPAVKACGGMQAHCYLASGSAGNPGCSNHHPPHNWPNWQAQARSRHLGGVNACFADGSVRFVRDSVALNIWEWMLSRNDGQTYDYDF